MPTYCTHGQWKRAYARSKASFADAYECRVRAMRDIDAAIRVRVQVPFNPWLRVRAISTDDLTLSLEDVAFLSAGDVLGIYKNDDDTLDMSITLVTVQSISGTTVSLDTDEGANLATNDEVAVRWTYVAPNGMTLVRFGPPGDIEGVATALSRYYGLGDIVDLDEPSDTIFDAYKRATDWLDKVASGNAAVENGTHRAIAWSLTQDEQPPIDNDAPENWRWSDKAKDRVENARD